MYYFKFRVVLVSPKTISHIPRTGIVPIAPPPSPSSATGNGQDQASAMGKLNYMNVRSYRSRGAILNGQPHTHIPSSSNEVQRTDYCGFQSGKCTLPRISRKPNRTSMRTSSSIAACRSQMGWQVSENWCRGGRVVRPQATRNNTHHKTLGGECSNFCMISCSISVHQTTHSTRGQSGRAFLIMYCGMAGAGFWPR